MYAYIIPYYHTILSWSPLRRLRSRPKVNLSLYLSLFLWSGTYTHTHTHTHTHIYIHIYTCMFTYLYKHTRTSGEPLIRVFVCICVWCLCLFVMSVATCDRLFRSTALTPTRRSRFTRIPPHGIVTPPLGILMPAPLSVCFSTGQRLRHQRVVRSAPGRDRARHRARTRVGRRRRLALRLPGTPN